MARGEIYLEDVDGAQAGANVRFVFLEGFDAESPAHQLANILRVKLDEMAQAGELVALTERKDIGANGDLFESAGEAIPVTADGELVTPSK